MGIRPKNRPKPGMNVTPLVDVVLVLLIIFMVITPLLAKQFWVHLPPQSKEEVAQEQVQDDSPDALVLSVVKEGKILLSGNEVPLEGLTEKLKRVYAARDDHVLFFDAADDVPYGLAVQTLDAARAGGALSIAVLTKRPENAE